MIVTHFGAQGDGVAGTLFVPGAAPGDTLVLGTDGKVATIIAGPDHTVPLCAHFGDCGGCTLQHVAMPAYAQWLSDRILMALRQHDVTPQHIEPPHVSPPRSRRRVVLKALRSDSGVVLGFNRKAQHVLVDITDCVVIDARITVLMPPLRVLLAKILKPGQAATVHITVADNGLDVMLADLSASGLKVQQALSDFAKAHDIARLSLRGPVGVDVIAQLRAPMLQLGGVDVALPVDSFTQATPQAEAAMIAAVLHATHKAKSIADLFCGIGTFALPLLQNARVHAVEASLAPLKALEHAARASQRQVTTEHRDLYRRPLMATELGKFQAVVFDPPRSGADAQVVQLAKSKVACVVAVSCNPNTFARDAATLCAGGYKLERLWPIGQFLWSTHVELVAQFVRR